MLSREQCNLRLLVKILKSGVSIFLEYRNSFLPTDQAKNIASTVDKVFTYILTSENVPIRDARFLSERNRAQLEKWNSKPLEHVKRTIHETIAETAQKLPSDEAICSWDGSFTYQELVERARRLAGHLNALRVGPEVIVPLCFDKSKWNVVAMLGVLFAGGACKLSFHLCTRVSTSIFMHVARRQGQ